MKFQTGSKKSSVKWCYISWYICKNYS